MQGTPSLEIKGHFQALLFQLPELSLINPLSCQGPDLTLKSHIIEGSQDLELSKQRVYWPLPLDNFSAGYVIYVVSYSKFGMAVKFTGEKIL